ncbi:DUF2142 domain-containing protein [Aurantimicrobium minutum]|uniref:DUF2142 domain-containing protein n=1 Tax=Aurantimicrobium minutum TaxID=708131 RepID=UPI00248EC90A|nr:DUF2142 domain-containing protein [Aurantimicrobium minutum]
MGMPLLWVRIRKYTPLIAIVGFFIALSGWAFSSPVGSSPDENFHLASTWCASGESSGLCESTGQPNSRLVPWQLVESSCFAFEPEESATCQNHKPNWIIEGLAVSTHGNFQDNYPPVFYSVMHLFVSNSIELSVLLMRLFNSLLFCLVVAATWFLISSSKRKVLFWMWAGTLIPLGMFLIPSVNPSSWAIISVGSSWLVLDAFFNQFGRKKILAGVLFAVLVVMAAGSRGDAAVYVCLSSLVVILLNFKNLLSRKLDILLPVAMGGVAAAFFFSSSQATVASTGLYSGGEVPVWSTSEKLNLLLANAIQVPALWAGVFGMTSIGAPAVSIGNLGWLDTQMPMIVWLPALAVFITLGYMGISKLSKPKLFSLAFVLFTLSALPLYVLQKSYATVGAEVQPRYLLPLIIVFLGIALLPPHDGEIALFRNKTQLVILVSSLVIANFVALHFVMRRFITGIDLHSPNLNAGIEWWWSGLTVQPMTVWLLATVFFAISVIAGSVAVGSKKIREQKVKTDA